MHLPDLKKLIMQVLIFMAYQIKIGSRMSDRE